MLFNSQVPQVFNRMAIDTYSTEAQARKAETAKRLNYFHDAQLDELLTILANYFSDVDKLQVAALNIVNKIISLLASTYTQPPVREIINGTDKDKELYASFLETSQFDVKVKQATKYAKLLGTILLRPVWRNNRVEVDILTGNILDVETGDSPEDLKKVLITDYGTGETVEEVEYSLWSQDTWQRLDWRGATIAEETNPYNVLPFIPIFDFPPPSNMFWIPCNENLMSLQEAINLKITDLLYLIRMQSFGVGWKKDQGSKGGTLQVDPGSMIELGADGSIGFESQKAEINAVVEAIDKIWRWACISYGLSASHVTTEPAPRQSGVAKQVDSKELAEMRRDDINNWRSIEKRTFDLVKLVHNTHTFKKKYSSNASLSIDFYDPTKESTSAKDQAETNTILLEQEVISRVDIIMQRNPDITTREDALAFLLKVKEENKQFE